MPRADSKFSGDASSSPNQGQTARKKHSCPTCDRCFTTSGHLARHSRVHTGEKNHKCPFPGCDTRCSRQDNLQQHYRIHLSPGSRRTSSRSSAPRRGKRASSGSSTADSSQTEYAMSLEHAPLSPPPLVPATIPAPSLSPPPLEQARAQGASARVPLYGAHSPPPDSPPPLAQATLPATYQHVQQRLSPVSSTSSSPEATYTAGPSSSFVSSSAVTLTPPPLASAHPPTGNANGYSYRNGATGYQEQPNGNYSYVQSPSESDGYSHQDPDGYENGQYTLPRKDDQSQSISLSASPSAVSNLPNANVHSRHSISHISHPSQQAYFPTIAVSRLHSAHNGARTGPPSPASSHSTSQSSGFSHSSPPTPSGYAYEADSSQYDRGIAAASPTLSAHSSGSGGNILEPSLSRYSPPPVLAPIQGYPSHESVEAMPRSNPGARVVDEQYERRASSRGEYHDRYSSYEARYAQEEPRYGRAHYTNVIHGRPDLSPVQTYMHPSPIAAYHDTYSPGGHVSLDHGAWKSENLVTRGIKSINALVQ